MLPSASTVVPARWSDASSLPCAETVSQTTAAKVTIETRIARPIPRSCVRDVSRFRIMVPPGVASVGAPRRARSCGLALMCLPRWTRHKRGCVGESASAVEVRVEHRHLGDAVHRKAGQLGGATDALRIGAVVDAERLRLVLAHVRVHPADADVTDLGHGGEARFRAL